MRSWFRSVLKLFGLTSKTEALPVPDINELVELANRTQEGDSDARCRLAGVMETVRQDAENGEAESQYLLAQFYFNGYLWPQNLTSAVQWARKAAAQGHAMAQYELGVAYAEGEGLAQDYRSAATLYRKSAEKGYHWAQNNLGMLLESGLGVKQDFEEAESWYEQAADQGNPASFTNLNILKILRISGTDHRIRHASEFAAPVMVGFYSDGRATLDDSEVTQEQLVTKCQEAATEGRVVIVSFEAAETEDSMADALRRLLISTDRNLRILFAGNDGPGNAPNPSEHEPFGPPNLVLYQPRGEYENRIGNGRETLNYLSSLCLALASAQMQMDNFFVVVALRPGLAKFWVLPAHGSNPKGLDSVTNLLEGTPLPTVKSGVVSFGFEWPGEAGLLSKDSQLPVPLSWQEVALKTEPVTVSDILDELWPPPTVQ